MKQCDGGPVFVQLWVGGVNPDRAQKAIIDLTSRMAACWSHTLNLLLAARGLLAEGEGYQLRHGYVQIGGERVMAFVIEVVYERFEKGRQVASVPCARFDLVRKNWLKVPMAQGGFCEPNSSSWPAAQQIFTEIVAAVSWIEINR